MLHTMNKYLVSQGHEVKVMTRGGDHVTNKNGKNYFKKIQRVKTFEGIDIFYEGVTMYNELFRWADVVITHLDQTGKAINLCRSFEKKLVHLIHNSHYRHEVVDINKLNHYIIYNSQWLKDLLKYPLKNTVLRPPVIEKDYRMKPTGKAITLINCYQPKGGDILVRLAEELPHRKFIGVMGYGVQVVGDRKNLTYLENTEKIQDVYKQSKIIIMPSTYESFGRVAIEAAAAGIPVIVTNTPGLKEALGDAGLFITNRDNIEEWVGAIKSLDNEINYKSQVAKGKKRAKELTLQAEGELKEFEQFLLKIKEEKYHV